MNRAMQHDLAGATAATRNTSQAGPSTHKAGLVSVGGILAALGAASCCVIPFALFAVGVSGAWIGNLTALAPYQPFFAAIAFGFLGYGFYLVYRKPRVACADDAYYARPSSGRTAKI